MNKYRLHDVFLSYRRYEDEATTDNQESRDNQGTRIAEAIYRYLESKGLDVFWDQPKMETGSFVDQLQWQLEHCPNYIFIGTENAKRFRQVVPPIKDYVAEEVRYALQKIHEQESLPNPSRDRVVLHIIPQKSDTQKKREAKGVLPNLDPYPEEIRELLNTQQGVKIDGELPSEEELEQILKYVTQVNRGNMWNAGSHWLEQATAPGKRFNRFHIIDKLMSQASIHAEEARFPILAYQEGESPQPLMNMINNTKGNLYLIGMGGIGKTTALFRIMEEAYKQDDKGRVERNRMNGQVPLFVELSGAPDVMPDSPSGKKWQVYKDGKSSFIHRAIYSQIRKGQRLRVFSEDSLEQIDEAYKMDYDAAVKPMVDLFSGDTPAPEYLLLLDGLNEISRREIKQYNADGELSFKRSVVSMVIEEIKTFMQYKNVRVILTSRSREATNWTEYATILDLSGVKTDTIKQYLLDNQVSEARLNSALNNDRLREVLRIPLFLILYGKLKGEEELLTAGEILHLFFHQRKQSGNYTQAFRTQGVHQSVLEASEGYEPASRLTPQMIGFILDFIIPRIGWEMLQAQEFHIRRDQLGDTGIGLDGIIEDVLMNTKPQRVCGQYGSYAFEEYFNETDGDTAAFAENMIDQLGGMKKAISAILYCVVMTLGVLYERNHEFGFTHHHLRDYFAAVHQISQLKLAVYLQKRGKNDIARQCLADWQAHPLHSEVRRFIGETLGEAHNAPTCDEQGNWHYAVPQEPCDRNLIKRGFDIFRGRFDGQDGYCVWNLLEILKASRGDLSGEDFSALDLTLCEANRHALGEKGLAVLLTSAKLNEHLLMPRGHTGGFNSASYSQDGRRIVTASDDGTAKVWDAETLQEIGTLQGHTGAVITATYSPDRRRIVTASWDTTAKVWDAETLQEIGTLDGHTHYVDSAMYSPDSRRIVTISWDKSANVWDTETLLKIGTLKGFISRVNSASYSPDGHRIVTASGDEDESAEIWDAETLQKIGLLKGHTSFIEFATYSPDGRRIVTASYDDTAKVWDAETFQEIGTLQGHTSSVCFASYSPDGCRIVTVSDDDTAKVWDAETLQEIGTLRGHTNCVKSAVYSPDGRRIVTASGDGTAKVWDAETLQEIGTLHGYTDEVNSAAYNSDGCRIVTASGDGTAKVWDTETMREIGTLKGHTYLINSAMYSPDSRRIVTASWDKTTKVWDAETFREIGALNGHTDYINSALYNPDGRKIITASWDKTAKVWDTETLQEIGVMQGHTDWVNYAVYSPDGRKIVTVSEDGTAKIWDAETLQEIRTLKDENESIIYSAAYSLDGRRIVISSVDETAKVLDTETLQEIGTLCGHTDEVIFASYSPDNCRIATASKDKTSKIWDARTLREIGTLQGHTKWVNSVTFSPDGRKIVTASSDGTTKIWDAETFECLHTIHNVPGLEVHGVDLRHLHPESRLSDETKERLYEYGAIVDERG